MPRGIVFANAVVLLTLVQHKIETGADVRTVLIGERPGHRHHGPGRSDALQACAHGRLQRAAAHER
jgi:hypothetical protein